MSTTCIRSTICVLKARSPPSWQQTDVPWDDLDDEGMTDPEPVYDDGPDDDDDD